MHLDAVASEGIVIAAANGLCGSIIKDWAAADIHCPLFFCPTTAGILEIAPPTLVEDRHLRTHIRHVETFLHGPAAPLVITGRAHMTAVIAALLIFVWRDTMAQCHVRVALEVVILPSDISLDVITRQLPRHPIRAVGLEVVRKGESRMAYDIRTIRNSGQLLGHSAKRESEEKNYF